MTLYLNYLKVSSPSDVCRYIQDAFEATEVCIPHPEYYAFHDYDGYSNTTTLITIKEGEEYIFVRTEDTTDQGKWEVVNNQIKFTPNASFIGGTVRNTYYLSTGSVESHATVKLSYPIVLNANQDRYTALDIEENATIDVLSNDIYDESLPIEILLDRYETPQGKWYVENNQVKFIPSKTFTGWSLFNRYTIKQGERIASESIDLYYPKYLIANPDEINLCTLDGNNSIIEFNILNNDTIQDDITYELYLIAEDGSYVKNVDDLLEISNDGIVKYHITQDINDLCSGTPNSFEDRVSYIIKSGDRESLSAIRIYAEDPYAYF